MTIERSAHPPTDEAPPQPHAPWSGTLPFRQYCEPFYPEFFQKAAATLGLNGTELLLDLGCGTGRIALGFAPYVRTLVGVDTELPMLERAGREAARQAIPIRLIHASVEKFHFDEFKFDCATLGNIHWWLDREQTHQVLNHLLSETGKVFICTALPLYDEDTTPWLTEFLAVRRRWNNFDYTPTALQPEAFMQGSSFDLESKVLHTAAARVPVDHLVKRALGYHPTSPDVLGDRVSAFADEIRTSLRPFADSQGLMIDKCYNMGTIFRRR